MTAADPNHEPDGEPWPELAASAPPEPSADFVARTLAQIEADDEVRLSRLLARHEVPRASADFVDRTLAAVRAPARGRRRAAPWLLAAAAVVIGAAATLLGRGSPPVSRLPELVYAGWTPAPFARSLANLAAPPAVGDRFFSEVRFGAAPPWPAAAGGGR